MLSKIDLEVSATEEVDSINRGAIQTRLLAFRGSGCASTPSL